MMPALNFQARFAELVESGQKRQTIRKPRKNDRDPKAGDTLQLYTGMRTKACRKLGEARCYATLAVHLSVIPGTGPVVRMEGIAPLRPGFRVLIDAAADAFAYADGFDDAVEMMVWFQDTHGLPFDGLLIRWDEPTREEKP